MVLHRSNIIVVLTLLVCAGACRRTEEDITLPSKPQVIILSDSNSKNLPAVKQSAEQHLSEQHTKRRKTTQLPDTIPMSFVPIDSGSTTSSEAAKDTAAINRFYFKESFANALRTPSSKIEKPYVHPDSQTWQDIAGIPQVQEEIPDWIKALGFANSIASILVIVYLLFFD
jgi:hypothetical protein